MHGAEFINMRQHHFDALCLRFEAVEPQKRIEPDQAAAGPVQTVHPEFKPGIRFALKPV